MTNLESFEGPQNLIDWSRSAIIEAQKVVASFINKENFPQVVEFNSTTGKYALKVKQTAPIPDDIARRLTEALNNARNSFDQSLFAASAIIGKPIKDAHYPWADNPGKDMGWKLEGKNPLKPRICPEFWDLIRSQEPYPTGNGYSGGNDLIRQVAIIANKKHTVGIRTGCGVSSRNLTLDFETREGGINFVGTPWCSMNNEIELLTWHGDVPKRNLQGNLAFYIAMNVPPPAGAMNALAVVENFIDKAQSVLDGFKDICTIA